MHAEWIHDIDYQRMDHPSMFEPIGFAMSTTLDLLNGAQLPNASWGAAPSVTQRLLASAALGFLEAPVSLVFVDMPWSHHGSCSRLKRSRRNSFGSKRTPRYWTRRIPRRSIMDVRNV